MLITLRLKPQYRISPYIHNTISSRQVMGIKKNINEEIVFLSHTKFSKLTTQKLYDRQIIRRITNEILSESSVIRAKKLCKSLESLRYASFLVLDTSFAGLTGCIHVCENIYVYNCGIWISQSHLTHLNKMINMTWSENANIAQVHHTTKMV